MTLKRAILLSVWLCLAAAFVFAQQQQKPITMTGLMSALKIGGLSAKELAQQITNRGVDFAFTPEVEAELRKAGASPDVIEAVRLNSPPPPPPSLAPPVVNPASKESARQGGSPGTVPAVVAAPVTGSQAGPMKPGVYYRKNGQWIELLAEGVSWRDSGKLKKFTVGLGKSETVGVIPGMASPNPLHDPVSFLLATPENLDVNRYFLVFMRDKGGMREIKVGAAGPNAREIVPIAPRRIGERMYQVDFSQGAGEYGFVAVPADSLPTQVVTFRIVSN